MFNFHEVGFGNTLVTDNENFYDDMLINLSMRCGRVENFNLRHLKRVMQAWLTPIYSFKILCTD